MDKIIKSITIDSDIWSRAKAKAKKENRNFSNLVEWLIIKWLEE